MSQELRNQMSSDGDGPETPRWQKRLPTWNQFTELELDFLKHEPKPYAFPLGQLAARSAGAIAGMPMRSWVFTGSRMRAAGLIRGCSPKQLAQSTGGVRSAKLAPSNADPATRALHAVGAALSAQAPVLCLLGKASLANGAVYEALNTASLSNAPVVFVILDSNITEIPLSSQHSASALELAQSCFPQRSAVSEHQLSTRSAEEQFSQAAQLIEAACAACTENNCPALLCFS